MKKLILTIIILLFAWPCWGATYTVCSSGCDDTVIQDIFDDNDLAPGDIVEVQADTVGGTKTYTESIVFGADDDGDGTGYVYLKARSGDTITLKQSAGNNIILTVQDYSRIEGFIVEGTDTVVKVLVGMNGIHPYIYNCTLKDSDDGSGTVALQFNEATDGTIDSCTFTDNGGDAIWFTGAGDDHTVKDCTFTGNGHGDAGDRDTIGSNGCTGIVIQDSTITHAGVGYAITGATKAGITVKRCKIYHTGGGTRTINFDPQGTYVVESNFIISNSSAYGIIGSIVDTGDPASFTIMNNSIYGADYGIFINGSDTIDAASVVIVQNNIMDHSNTRHIRLGHTNVSNYTTIDYNQYGDDAGTKFQWAGNLYTYAQWKANTIHDDNSAVGDPKHVSATDLHLLVSSPCIDAGDNLTATVLTDIDAQDADHANMDGDADGAVTDMDIGADQVLFLSVLTGGVTSSYVEINGENGNVAGLSLSGDNTLDNYTIALCKSGALRVNANDTIYNFAIDDEAYIISGVTLTATNYAFQEAEAVVAVDGTITDTDCLFSVTDFGFRDKSSGNFILTRGSVLNRTGTDTGAGTDVDGLAVPYRGSYSVGAHRNAGSSSSMGMGLNSYCPHKPED